MSQTDVTYQQHVFTQFFNTKIRTHSSLFQIIFLFALKIKSIQPVFKKNTENQLFRNNIKYVHEFETII